MLGGKVLPEVGMALPIAVISGLAAFPETKESDFRFSFQRRLCFKLDDKPMKTKLTAITIVVCATAFAQEPVGQDISPLIQGAWVLTFPDGSKRIKFISNGQWTITQSDPGTGAVVFHHGGTYTLDGRTYIERVVFANTSTAGLIGKEHKFELTVEGETIHQKGIGNPWTEDWKRIKP